MICPADIAWSRQLTRTSRRQVALWCTAALIMTTAHAGAAWFALRSPGAPEIQIAGGPAIEVDLAALGFAEADQVSSGEMAEAVEPVEAEAVEEVQPEVAEAVETATPVEITRAEPVEPVTEATPTEVQPEEAIVAEAVPSPVSRLAEAVSEVQIAALPPVENEAVIVPEATLPVEQEIVEPLPDEVELEVAALVHVPLPSARPENTKPAEQRVQPQAKPKPKQEATRQRERRPSPGNGGQNQADARRGTAEGSTQGRATNQDAGNQRSREAGNAAVSNYPGQVAKKLSRAARSTRARDRGEVLVSFTVSSSGSVSGLRIARGSGSAQLDQAALATVNRAAPFPPIPQAAGRSSWTFNLPIAFSR